jgi:hypothetical protein
MVAGLGYQLLKKGVRSPWDVGVNARVPEFRGHATPHATHDAAPHGAPHGAPHRAT